MYGRERQVTLQCGGSLQSTTVVLRNELTTDLDDSLVFFTNTVERSSKQ